MENMSWDKKVRVVEGLWESQSQEEARLRSPPWHKIALGETATRHDGGEEQPIGWDAAKRELRSRAE
jgi:Putative addiction module component